MSADSQHHQMQNLIEGSDNLDEEISVVDFIKTLKKVESADTLQSRDSNGSSSSLVDKSKTDSKPEDRKIDKKASANDILQTMRKRFVHRATEPVFHGLESSTTGTGEVSRSVVKSESQEAAPTTQ